MPQKTLIGFLDSSKTPSYKESSYRLYEVVLEVHGYLWFHTVAVPTSIGWVHQVAPVIHNYPLILGFLGRLVEESYANRISEPSYETIRRLIRKYSFYVYPAIVTKAITRRIQFTGIGEGHVSIRGKTRLTYPERGFNTLLLPGTTLKTYILAKEEFVIPEYIRIGAKRTGLLKVKELKTLKYNLSNYAEITHPANRFDAEVKDGIILLAHRGGDVVVLGKTSKSIIGIRRGGKGEERVVLAYPISVLGVEG